MALPLALGGAALVLGPLVALGRVARPFPRALSACLAGVALAAPIVAVLGHLIEQKTHHRPLGAATFAVLALGLALGSALLVGRVLSVLTAGRASLAALGLGLGVVVLIAAKAFTGAGAFSASLVDGTLVVGLGLLGIALPLSTSRERALERFGLPLFGVLALACVVLSRTTAGAIVGEVAPVLAPLNGW